MAQRPVSLWRGKNSRPQPMHASEESDVTVQLDTPEGLFLLAIKYNDLTQARQLLATQDPPINVTKRFGKPYYASLTSYAYESGSVAMVDLLVEHGANLREHDKRDGFAPIHWAAGGGNTEVVRSLVEKHRVPIDTLARSHFTPLHLACIYGETETVKLLLQKGADVNAVNSKVGLLTPLFGAAISQDDEMLITLVEAGADVNFCDLVGNTVLHRVSKTCTTGVLLALLRNGALLGTRNKHGFTPLMGLRSELLQQVLDACIQRKVPKLDDNFFKDSYELQFRSPFGANKQDEEYFDNDLKNIIAISKSKHHENLIFHPVVKSLIALKWQKTQWLFFFQMVVYLTFTIVVSVYSVLWQEPIDFLHPSAAASAQFAVWLVMLVFITCLGVNLLVQATVMRLKYWWRPEHTLEAIVLALVIALMAGVTQELDVPVVFLTWTLLFLRWSRHPFASTYFCIFHDICLSYLRLLLFFLALLLAFILSFYMLFQGCKNENCVEGAFSSFISATLKVVSMTLGEVSFDSFPLEYRFPSWATLYALFLFFIAFVLMNMLNGLAVADTQALIHRAKFMTLVAQAQWILYVDTFVKKAGRWDSNAFQRFAKRLLRRMLEIPQISEFTIAPSSGRCMAASIERGVVGSKVTPGTVKEAELLTRPTEGATEVTMSSPQHEENIGDLKNTLEEILLKLNELADLPKEVKELRERILPSTIANSR